MKFKTSVAEKNDWKENLIRKSENRPRMTESLKCYPLLFKTFEENGGVADTKKLDELQAAIGDELTRSQIIEWFYRQRKKFGIRHVRKHTRISRRVTRFSRRVKSVLLHVFAETSGYITGIELDELEETLDGELTRKQILNWFCHERIKRGIR